MKNTFCFIIFIICALLGTLSVGYALVMQAVLSFQRFGVLFSDGNFFIPDSSAWHFFGVLFEFPAFIFWIKSSE